MPDKNSFSITGLCKIERLAIISVSGADAVSFLHSQLTNDINSLQQNRACLAGYCTPKGRLLATMLAWKSGETVHLEVPTELQESLQKRLQMFVMRSKVTLHRSENIILGILGESALAQLSEWLPEIPAEPYQAIQNEAGYVLRLTDADGVARYQWILSNSLFEQIQSAVNLPEHVWARSEILAGIPHVNAATQEKFVPQMVNYELIGGVNFKKGCYPGQEIVARTHYLGKQKRRTVLASIDNINVQSGMEVFASDDPSQPCGMIVNAAPNGAGGSDCLIEMKLNFLNNVVKLASGEICHWLAMPYSLPTEE